ncbi:Spo0E family sporulation regulatory protein-aspartic acid phosphatase [Peribacillus sp. SCS-155]|uniref:Spo0E family sporulation regulatory protein-aspartic acid phosphatase n=1 Tax=Peribacillus sedimenti TaxID=3115297 RepID=UPI003906A14E
MQMKNLLEQDMELEIESVRQLLVKTALQLGFTDPKTVSLSQHLDDLFNKFHSSRKSEHAFAK